MYRATYEEEGELAADETERRVYGYKVHPLPLLKILAISESVRFDNRSSSRRNLRDADIQDQHADLRAPDRQNHRMFGHKHPFAPCCSLRDGFWSQRRNFICGQQIRASARRDAVEGNAQDCVPYDAIGHHIVVDFEVGDAKATYSSSADLSQCQARCAQWPGGELKVLTIEDRQ